VGAIDKRRAKDGSDHYRVQIRLSGHKPVRKTFRRKGDAQRWMKKTEAAILEGRTVPSAKQGRRTLGDVIDRYIETFLPKKPKSLKKQSAQLQWWKKHYGHLILSRITQSVLCEARDRLGSESTPRGSQRAPATVKRYMAALSHAFTIAIQEWEWLETNPLRRVRRPIEPRGRVRFLDEDERDRLLAACRESRSPLLYPVVLLALSTGMRRGEIMQLRHSDVDLQLGRITIEESKNGERRVVPLQGPALENMKRLLKVRRMDTRLVFPGRLRPTGDVHPANLETAWKKAVGRAELLDFRFHDLRHTAASHLAMNGATVAELAAILGHKTLAMVQRYAHLSVPHTTDVVGRMNAAFLGSVESS
jgi:integrase